MILNKKVILSLCDKCLEKLKEEGLESAQKYLKSIPVDYSLAVERRLKKSLKKQNPKKKRK